MSKSQLSLFGSAGYVQTVMFETANHKPDVIAGLRCLGIPKDTAEELAGMTAGKTPGEWIANALRIRNRAMIPAK